MITVLLHVRASVFSNIPSKKTSLITDDTNICPDLHIEMMENSKRAYHTWEIMLVMTAEFVFPLTLTQPPSHH
jgi:hypothetical protein